MASIATGGPTGDPASGAGPRDPLRRVIHVALAIYLMPVVAIVCAIGGAAIAFDKAARLAGRFAVKAGPGPNPGPSRSGRSARGGAGSLNGRDRGRTRVGR